MSSYIIMDRNTDGKQLWNQLVAACAVVGESFEIHCWADEKQETLMAQQFGIGTKGCWREGTVIRGVITREFLSFLLGMEKPADTAAYNKMTPFFTLILGNRLHSEHYGTELILPRSGGQKQKKIDGLLNRLEDCARVYRNVG